MLINSIGVLQVLEDYSHLAGGLPEVVSQLTQYVSGSDIEMRIIHAGGDRSDPNAQLSKPSYHGRKWRWNSRLKSDILQSFLKLENPSLVHVHGIWTAPQYFSSRLCLENQIPFILTAHGMLEPWLWKNQGIHTWVKKNIYWHAFAYPVFKSAAVVHAITNLERDNFYRLLPEANIEVIPNAIDTSKYDLERISAVEKEKIILFLGRIEPKKGVHLLIEAFARAKIDKDWRLVIVGPSWSERYMKSLHSLVNSYGLSKRVQFKGACFGLEKEKIIERSWVLVAPSYSEVVGMVNLESSIRGVPTITTYNTGLLDWESGGGLLTNPEVEDIRIAIERCCKWGFSERFERGIASRLLVERKYSWKVVAPMWRELYLNLVRGWR